MDYSVLQQCMHCGMCLPTCPTYEETKLEKHSPRGRIALMRAIADEEIVTTKSFGEEMYYCLGCLACVTACPAGVNYAQLFEAARAEVERSRVLASPARSLIRWSVIRIVFLNPRLFRMIGRLLWFYQASGVQTMMRRVGFFDLLPERLRDLEPQMPKIRKKFSSDLIEPVETAVGTRRYRVAVLTGCVQDIAFSEINRATVDVLRENSCEVHTHSGQVCCGSLHAHNGDVSSAKELARRLITLVPPENYDAIISNAGGCGSHLRHFDRLLSDDLEFAKRSILWSKRVRDIHEWLVEIGFRRPRFQEQEVTVITYHDSCHLCHGQKVYNQPRDIVKSIPGFEFRECTEATWCCGSAGIYNITQPRTAAWLQRRKLTHLRATGAAVIATANPGCHMQIVNALSADGGSQPRVVHPVVLLAEAYGREAASGAICTRE
jgi:glycolate oxidase iron-sulfur subunit